MNKNILKKAYRSGFLSAKNIEPKTDVLLVHYLINVKSNQLDRRFEDYYWNEWVTADLYREFARLIKKGIT